MPTNSNPRDRAPTRAQGNQHFEIKTTAIVVNANRRIIHWACHGLTDQAFGNFFGALALTLGENHNDPEDNGLLTLPEIYALDLKAAELAILSACATNCGVAGCVDCRKIFADVSSILKPNSPLIEIHLATTYKAARKN